MGVHAWNEQNSMKLEPGDSIVELNGENGNQEMVKSLNTSMQFKLTLKKQSAEEKLGLDVVVRKQQGDGLKVKRVREGLVHAWNEQNSMKLEPSPACRPRSNRRSMFCCCASPAEL